MDFIFDNYIRLQACSLRFYLKYMSYNTPYWIVSKLASECIEITCMCMVLLQYGGYKLNVLSFLSDNNDDTLISELPIYIKFLAVVVACNGGMTGSLWIINVSFPNKFSTKILKYWLLVVDSIFELMYSLFPLIIVSDFEFLTGNFWNKIGILQQFNTIQFLSVFFPLAFLILKINISLQGVILAAIPNVQNSDANTNDVDARKQFSKNLKTKEEEVSNLSKETECCNVCNDCKCCAIETSKNKFGRYNKKLCIDLQSTKLKSHQIRLVSRSVSMPTHVTRVSGASVELVVSPSTGDSSTNYENTELNNDLNDKLDFKSQTTFLQEMSQVMDVDSEEAYRKRLNIFNRCLIGVVALTFGCVSIILCSLY